MLQGFCWSIEDSKACIYKDVSGSPLAIASTGDKKIIPGTKAIVTTLPPVTFEDSPKCKGEFNKDNEDESGRFWAFEVGTSWRQLSHPFPLFCDDRNARMLSMQPENGPMGFLTFDV